MIKIAILSPDAIRLPLVANAPEYKEENGKLFLLKDKCSRATAIGQRVEYFANILSEDFDVTVLVPDLNYPGRENIDAPKLKFKTLSYDWFAANWKYSKDLADILSEFDVVIIPTTTGTGFKNVSNLSKNKLVIADGWVPFLVEFPCALLSYDDDQIRSQHWNKGVPQYMELMRRVDLILYANDTQGHFYEGLSMCLGKLNYNSYKSLPIMKVPYGVENKYPTIETKRSGATRLIWYGSIYPWYNPFPLAEAIKNSKTISVDFIGLEHPRFKKLHKNKYKEIFEEYDGIRFTTEYNDNQSSMLYEYDAGIIIAQNWLENKYSNRCRIFDMISHGLPVIMNEGSPLFKEDILKPVLFGVSIDSLKRDLEQLCNESDSLAISKEFFDEIYYKLSWKKCLEPLINYIGDYSREKTKS